nr:MAG TPA: hypothetical protein [Caudoviricetes sp.]
MISTIVECHFIQDALMILSHQSVYRFLNIYDPQISGFRYHYH